MNYRHAFHAGNFADCFKHALLVWLLRALARKPAACAVLDTHAGAGRCSLGSGAALRTGEWRGGIARLMRRIHDGDGMSVVWQVIIFAAGIIPAILAVTGIIMWWRARGWRNQVKARRAAVRLV